MGSDMVMESVMALGLHRDMVDTSLDQEIHHPCLQGLREAGMLLVS